MSHNLLLVDDDIEFCDLLKEYLASEGFTITAVHDGEQGYQQATQNAFDIIILDVMLPKMNGFEALKKIKAEVSTPVLMLTAKGEEVDQVVGLEIGADDYLPKPCSPRLLVARLKAILRRAQQNLTEQLTSDIIRLGSIELNNSTREVFINSNLIEFTNSEYNILACLMNKSGKVVTKEELSEQGLNRKIQAFDRSVDMHISHLRSKLHSIDENLNIKTIRGIGYMLEKQ